MVVYIKVVLKNTRVSFFFLSILLDIICVLVLRNLFNFIKKLYEKYIIYINFIITEIITILLLVFLKSKFTEP